MNSIKTHNVLLFSTYYLNLSYLSVTSQILSLPTCRAATQCVHHRSHGVFSLIHNLHPSSQIPRVKVKIAPVGSASAREPDNSQNNNNTNTNSQLRSSVAASRMPNRLSMFSRIHARMSWASLNVGAPRSVFQAETVYPPGHAEGRHAGLDMKVWSHGPYKCAVIVRKYTPNPPHPFMVC